MASSGPLNPATFASSSFGTVDWTNSSNSSSSNNSYATADLNNTTTYYLKATNFGFAIPVGSTIDGIVIEVERSCTNASGSMFTARAQGIKAGTIVGTNQGTGIDWSTTDTYVTYGGSTNLLGTTWTVSDINNSGFGAAIAVTERNAVANTARIDHIRITVYYTPPPPVIANAAPVDLVLSSLTISQEKHANLIPVSLTLSSVVPAVQRLYNVLPTSFTFSAAFENLITNLISFWQLDETSGTTADDTFGSNNGTLQGNAAFVAGKLNNGVTFDGTGDYISVPSHASLVPTDGLTISIWCKTTVADKWLVDRMNTGLTQGYMINGSGAGPLSFWVNNKLVSASDSILTGLWTHVVGVWTPGISLQIFYNGVSKGINTTAIPLTITDPGLDLWFGRRRSGADYWNGQIDEPAIFGRALNSTEILRLYNAGSALNYVEFYALAPEIQANQTTVNLVFSTVTPNIPLFVYPSPTVLTLTTVTSLKQIQLSANTATFTFSTTEIGITVFAYTTPVNLVFSTVTVLREIQASTGTTTLNFSTLTSSQQLESNQIPINLVFSTLTPTLERLYNVGTVDLVFSITTPNIPLFTYPSSVSFTLSTLVSSQEINTNAGTVDLIFSSITATYEVLISIPPVELVFSTLTASLEKVYNQVPIDLVFTTISSLQNVAANVNTVDLVFSTLTASYEIVYNLTPVNLVFNTINATTGAETSASPASFAFDAIDIYYNLEFNAEPLNLSIEHNAEFDPQILSCVNALPTSFEFLAVSLLGSVETSTDVPSFEFSVLDVTSPLVRNVSPLNLVFSVIAVETVGGEPRSAIIITTLDGIESKPHLFAAFSERLKFVEYVVSEFVLENANYPYISLGQSYNVLSWKDSCLARFEESHFRLSLYSEDYVELKSLIDDIENTLIYNTLLLDRPKKVISLDQVQKQIAELKRELYVANLVYEVIVQKDIDQTYIRTPTSGETLNKCIYQRFKDLINLSSLVKDFVSPGYAAEKTDQPYITVPKITEQLDWNNTKGRIDGVKYPITVHAEDLHELIAIMDEVENSYDYCRFIIGSGEHLINEWVGTEIVELEPQQWVGKVNYEILVESSINEYNE